MTKRSGAALRLLSRLHWFAGNGGPAEATALEAIAILEALGESVELARAYSGLSQLAMLAQDIDQALVVGQQGARAGDAPRRRQHACSRPGQHRSGEGTTRSE